jgi:hypothetical protein
VVQTGTVTISSVLPGSGNQAVPIGPVAPLLDEVQYEWRTTGGSVDDDSFSASSYQTWTPSINRAPTCSLASPVAGVSVSTLTPTLTLNFTDPDTATLAKGQFSAYQLQVRRVSDGLSFWDPGIVAATSPQQTARQAAVTYAGTTLVNGTAYEWRARVQDGGGLWSDYTSWASFTPNAVPGAPTSLAPSGLTNTLTPTISGVYVQSTGSTEDSFQYEIQQNAATIYSSGDVAADIATGQTYGTANGSDTPSSPPALAWGTTYAVRARSKDALAAYGPWTAWTAFNTNAAPTAPTNIVPGGGAIVASSTPTISWTHNDADSDAQTVVDIEIFDVTADAFLTDYDPNTLTQATLTHVVATALTLTHQYSLRIRTKGTAGPGYGPYSAATLFTYATAPAIVLTAPAADDVLSVPTLTVTWTFSGGSGTQTSYEVFVYADDGTTIVYDSGVIASTDVTTTVPAGYLHNSETYLVQVSVIDSLTQAATTSKVQVTTSFTAPAAVTGLTATALGSQD